VVILLELSEDDMVRRMLNLLNYGSFREWCRHRLGLGASAYGTDLPISKVRFYGECRRVTGYPRTWGI
jgi:hypothetical protein